MRDNISPEENLLRLIRKGKKESITPQAASPIPQPQKYLSFFSIRRIILIAFAVSCIYLAFSLFYPLVGLKKVKLPKISEAGIPEPKTLPQEEAKPYEFYQKAMEERRLFSSAPQAQVGAAQPVGAANADLIKDINLVGIISGENPQAIIEDKKSQKTYYVTKGQFIGELQVEDIQEGKIIVNYRGQRLELYL